MPNKNRYQKFSKIFEQKFRKILRFFAIDLTASDTAHLTGVSTRTVNNLFLKLRRRMAEECEKHTPFSGVVELDESYFGAKRIRGKRGRGAGGKTIVFGILKRDNQVYTEIVPDASKATLQKVIKGHISAESVINTEIPMAGEVITVWLMWAMKNTFVFIMATMNLLAVRNISTVSSHFGVMQKTGW